MTIPKSVLTCLRCKKGLPREQFFWNGRINKRCISCHEEIVSEKEAGALTVCDPVPGEPHKCRRCGEVYVAYAYHSKGGKEYVSHLCEECRKKSSLERSETQRNRVREQGGKNAIMRRSDENVNTLWRQGMSAWSELQFFVPGVGNLSGDSPQVCPLR